MNQLLRRKNEGLRKNKKKGFTLVELIIVIAIIAILAAIAIPKFGQIRTSANANADVATAKNIATVVATRLADGTIADTLARTVVGTGTGQLNLSADIDGSLVPKVTGKTAFSVEVTTGNIEVFYDAETTAIYPE